MTKIVLVGAGSMQFGAGVLGDVFQSSILHDAEIVLNDINEQAVKKTLALAQDYLEARDLKHTVRYEMDLRKALVGCDFVIISIEVGDRFALWDMDWRIPQQYGFQQVFGENGGPGGLFHSLRIIPPILEICKKIMEVAPKATVFNYSNPMSRICTTVHRAFPDLQFIGMCHEIASLYRHLPPLLNRSMDEIHFRAAGLNHFSVLANIQEAKTGKDLYDEVRSRAADYFRTQPGYSEILNHSRKSHAVIETEGWMEIDLQAIKTTRPWSDRWLFRVILERFGVLPITVDSHLGEYVGWAEDVADHRGNIDFLTLYRHHLFNVKPAITDKLHERVVPIIEAMTTGKVYEESAVNIPNKGLLDFLPDWIVVEVPAQIEENGPHGISIDLPAGFQGLLTNQIGIHNLTAEAIMHGSRELAIQALLVDPTTIHAKRIPEMFDHIIAEQSPWLDYLT